MTPPSGRLTGLTGCGKTHNVSFRGHSEGRGFPEESAFSLRFAGKRFPGFAWDDSKKSSAQAGLAHARLKAGATKPCCGPEAVARSE